MYYTYILKSKKNNKFYTGYTKNIIKRLSIHNSRSASATKNSQPWELFYIEEFENEADAVKREHQIKSWKSRKAIEKLKFI